MLGPRLNPLLDFFCKICQIWLKLDTFNQTFLIVSIIFWKIFTTLNCVVYVFVQLKFLLNHFSRGCKTSLPLPLQRIGNTFLINKVKLTWWKLWNEAKSRKKCRRGLEEEHSHGTQAARVWIPPLLQFFIQAPRVCIKGRNHGCVVKTKRRWRHSN